MAPLGAQVGEVEADHLADAQAQVGQDRDDGLVALPGRATVGLGGGQQRVDLGGAQPHGGGVVADTRGRSAPSTGLAGTALIFTRNVVPAGQAGQLAGHGGRASGRPAVIHVDSSARAYALTWTNGGTQRVDVAATAPGEPGADVTAVRVAGVRRQPPVGQPASVNASRSPRTGVGSAAPPGTSPPSPVTAPSGHIGRSSHAGPGIVGPGRPRGPASRRDRSVFRENPEKLTGQRGRWGGDHDSMAISRAEPSRASLCSACSAA